MAPRRFQAPTYQPPRPPGRPRHSARQEPEPAIRTTVMVQPESIGPRLLDLPATATYLGVSIWTVRDLEANGTLKRIRIPLMNHGELRKLLFDKADLDQLIGVWKAGG